MFTNFLDTLWYAVELLFENKLLSADLLCEICIINTQKWIFSRFMREQLREEGSRYDAMNARPEN